jgi:protein YIPF1/2
LYGYSLAVYIPVSVLWTIQFSLLQWLLVSTAAFLSGSVLIFVMIPALRYSKYSFIIMVSIAVAHFILAAGFMLYFFHVPASNLKEHMVSGIVATPAPAIHKNTTH